MKKKPFAALAAAAMLCCTLAAPVSAAETYQMGDINMDGEIDCCDALLLLQEYVITVVAEDEGAFTDEQKQLTALFSEKVCSVLHIDLENERSPYMPYIWYANSVLHYYVCGLSDPTVKEQNIVDWIEEYFTT